MCQISDSPGWDHITQVFGRLYPGQTEPLHYATLLSWRLGGEDPLDGVSIYEGDGFYHFVTYGFTELYDKESEDPEYSGWGFELTLKLKKTPDIDKEELGCLGGVLQQLARYVFEEQRGFAPGDYIYTGQETGMDAGGQSKITGFFIQQDEAAGRWETPSGKMEFLQLVGATDRELKAVLDGAASVEELLAKIPGGLTDYTRGDLV